MSHGPEIGGYGTLHGLGLGAFASVNHLRSATVPSKIYTIGLNEHAYLVVDFQSNEGEILAFVVRLVHIVGHEHRDVARYDTAQKSGGPEFQRFGVPEYRSFRAP